MSENITYQTQLLTPELSQVLIIDDSPEKVANEFWEFLGIDITMADIKPWDFWNMLDFLDIDILNKLGEFPESEWEKIAIVEYVEVKENGKVTLKPVKAYPLVRIWDKLRTKVYIKMCRAREAITLKSMTTNTSVIDQRLREVPSQPSQEVGVPHEERGWKV